MNLFGSHVMAAALAEALVSVLLVGLGFLAGKYRERREQRGRDLTEYDFYPYVETAEHFAEFSLRDFRLGMHYFLHNRDARAARQLIFIGEQNGVRDALNPEERRAYQRLYARYHGAEVTSDAQQYLENYSNIVRLLGRTFPQMGIEILLHDLANPSRSIVCIEGAEVTGRSLQMGTTALLVDLKKRRALNQDKLNYELNLGARRFKCTTIPIIRKEYGVVGAICMNIDVNYIRDEVLTSAERIEAFFRHYCQTDMQLSENILSKEEYQKALHGKRHFRDAVGATT
ncbi:MAG TPA: PAS domain-containing protein [Steroidobacteraceae bacterium]|nr:PAS domain-containing protein [Steroidobacteraceae bacterium]